MLQLPSDIADNVIINSCVDGHAIDTVEISSCQNQQLLLARESKLTAVAGIMLRAIAAVDDCQKAAVVDIGIKHGISCINSRRVPREMLKTEAGGPRDLANVNALTCSIAIIA